MIKFLDLGKQYQSIKKEIDAAIAAVLQDSAFVGGKYVQQFEEAFAAYQQTQYCVGVGNGTDAIEIALEALALPPQSEIIVPANSFIASSEAVTRTGHRVVFCDCDPQTYTISLADCQRRITPQTRAIIAVHLYGQPADLEALQRLAQIAPRRTAQNTKVGGSARLAMSGPSAFIRAKISAPMAMPGRL